MTIKRFDEFINEAKKEPSLIGKMLATGWDENIKVTKEILASVTEFLSDHGIDVNNETVKTLLANYMPDQKGTDLFTAGKGASIETSDFDSWEDVQQGFVDDGFAAGDDPEADWD